MPKRPLLTTALVLAAFLLATAPAGAKGRYAPGDLRLCNDRTCSSITDRTVLDGLARFSWRSPGPAEVRAPRIGAPYLQLKTRNGGLMGIVATMQIDRFRSHWGTLQFAPEDWYRMPISVARRLRALASGLAPLRVTSSTVGPIRYG